MDVGLTDSGPMSLSSTHPAAIFGGGTVTKPDRLLKPHPTGNRTGREGRPRPPDSVHWHRHTDRQTELLFLCGHLGAVETPENDAAADAILFVHGERWEGLSTVQQWEGQTGVPGQ